MVCLKIVITGQEYFLLFPAFFLQFPPFTLNKLIGILYIILLMKLCQMIAHYSSESYPYALGSWELHFQKW
jgi:hypothetical protein